ncbi:methyl-accepting chemotaxis protein [Massilia niastensis]|uniref:methyl-accepting chemotaxis protein n=1 Tax=Massilia niastensis TaxID=544911 RepID=UPI00059482F7|nr:methyl-accepting chemotaxis protein [Massilia niastensis]
MLSTGLSGLTIRARVCIGFAVILFLMIVLTGIGVSRVNTVSAGLSTIGDVNSVKQRYAINFRGSVHDRAISLRDLTLVESDDEIKKVLSDIARLTSDYQKSAVLLDGMFGERTDTRPDERQILASIKEIEARTLPMIAKVIALRQAGEPDRAKELMLTEARPAFVEWLARINKFIDLQEEMNQSESAHAREVASGFQELMLIMCAAAVATGTLVAAVIVRAILRALGGEPAQASAIANRIATGDLAVVIDTDESNRSSVLFAMKDMRDSLLKIVAEVRSSTHAISAATHEIASGNLNLSSRTELQASSLQETASAMEQLTSTVKQNADNALQANRLAVSAAAVALKGGEVVSQVVKTMESINTSSKKIVDIISVIDGIAFQTNILALNAAVEAARAGEQGRGFAVVATEVRNLAQRSAAAAKEIKILIGDSVDKVDAGSQLVAEAGSTMDEIVGSVNRVTDIMADITAASQEQSVGIEQVNRAIGQMDQVTQQNAALVDEAAAGASSLQEQAKNLGNVVAIFKLAGRHANPQGRDRVVPALAGTLYSGPRS